MGCDCFIKALGYILIAVVAKKILISLYNIFFPYFIGTPIDLKKKAGGKWAVVTGSTDGIGKAYATELGRRGFNLLLVSRNQQKLDDTKKEIESEAAEGVEIRTERFDFNAPLAADYAPLEKSLKSIDVGILVNNVGLSYEYPEELQKVEGGLERLQQITTTNVLPPTLLSAIVLPQMVERHAGIIINIASAAAYNKMALWAVYSATKKYVQWFSGIIRGETAGRGVIVQTVLPMLVATKMSKVSRTNFFTPNAKQFAKAALRTIGLVDETTGYFSHQIQVEAMFALPQELVDFLTTKHSKDIRARAIRKKEKETEKSK